MIPTNSSNATNNKLVIPHFGIASTCWFVVLVFLCCNYTILHGHYFNFKLIALTHLFVLGFVSMIILGALYQLIPVIFTTKLFSEKWAFMTLFFLLSGTIFIFIGFWFLQLKNLLVLGGLFVCVAVFFFVLNILLSIQHVAIDQIEKKFILSSAIWFFITCFLGFLLALNLFHPFLTISHIELLKTHAHFGIVAWCIQLIIGVASVLLPMFLISHNLSKKTLIISFYLLNFSLILGATGQLVSNGIVLKIAFLGGALSLLLFLYFMLKVYQIRIKKKLDLGMKKSFFALILLMIPIVLALLLTIFKFDNLDLSVSYILSILIGFISTIIMGQTFKTLPFIIWLREFKSVVGKEKTPLPKDLYHDKMLKFQVYLHFSGIILLLFSLLFKLKELSLIALILLLAAALLYNINVYKLVFYKKQKL